jgi:hypothetical protein
MIVPWAYSFVASNREILQNCILKKRGGLAKTTKGKECLGVAWFEPMARVLLKPVTNRSRFARANVFSTIFNSGGGNQNPTWGGNQ